MLSSARTYLGYCADWSTSPHSDQGESGTFRALKIIGAEDGTFEKDVLIHLRRANETQPGYPYICHLVDEFEHKSPDGTHICLVFELSGETLRSFGAWFAESMIPT